MKLETQYTNYCNALAALQRFAAIYDERIPEDFISVSLNVEGEVNAYIHLTWHSDENRDRALCLIGDAFGRDGWVAVHNESCHRPAFDWKKEVYFVHVRVYTAKLLPKSEGETPVRPQDFPVLLHDTAIADDVDLHPVEEF